MGVLDISRLVFILFVFIGSFSLSCCQAPVPVTRPHENHKDTVLSIEQECSSADDVCAENIIAIQELHKKIDDDKSGNIDQSESNEFFRDELQNTDGFERQSLFHGNDKQISTQDLWSAWKKSIVYNWTVEETVEWLVNFAELPQYKSNFESGGINGTYLPRMAVNNNHFISRILNIKNPVHKHRLMLKAMDVVLFGSQKHKHNFLINVALVTALVIAMGFCWFAYMQNKSSQGQVKKMIKDLDALQKTEDSLSEMLQKKEKEQHAAIMEKNRLEQKYHGEIENAKVEAERLRTERENSNLEENSRLALAEQELQQVREALQQAENELASGSYWCTSPELQQYLQYTYEIEHQHFTVKQQAAQRQFASAKDACEKIRKKRTGMLGTLRMAQGNSIDDIDQRIMQARMALEEIRHDLQERQQRWQAIESFCGFPIRSNPGMSKLEHGLYGDSGSHLAMSMVAPLNVEEADEDFPPQYTAATGDDKSLKPVKLDSSEKVAKYFKKWRIRSHTSGLSSIHQGSGKNSPTGQGGSTLADLKRRPVNMGSTNSLSNRLVPANMAVLHGSQDNLAVKSAVSSAGPSVGISPVSGHPGALTGGHVSFHLGANSPASSPDSPDSKTVSEQKLPIVDPKKMARSKSYNTVQGLQNGSKIPMREVPKTLNVSENRLEHSRANSESNFQKSYMLQHHAMLTPSVSVQDDESLSGTESNDSDPKNKDKKKRLKFIPKFMRKTEHDKQKL